MRIMLVATALLALVASSGTGGQGKEVVVSAGERGRAVPKDHSVSALSVVVGRSRGSGFFLQLEEQVWLVTARHVVFDRGSGALHSSKMNLLYWPPPGDTQQDRGSLTVDLEAALKGGGLLVDDPGDVLAVALGRSGDRRPAYVTGPGGRMLVIDRPSLLPFEEVLVGNEVYVYGYPTAIGLKQLPQVDFSRPLLRRGIVAGLNQSLQTILLDVMLHRGNSGGPVWHLEKTLRGTYFRVIGVVLQQVPLLQSTSAPKVDGQREFMLDNSGYAVAAPIARVTEMIDAKSGQ